MVSLNAFIKTLKFYKKKNVIKKISYLVKSLKVILIIFVMI